MKQQQRSWFTKNRGFTLLECMIVVLLLIIFSSIAVPSLSDWREKREFAHVLKLVSDLAKSARAQALIQNQSVNLQVGTEGGGCVILTQNMDCSCSKRLLCEADDKSTYIALEDWNMTLSNSNKQSQNITFTPNGTLHFGSASTLTVGSKNHKGKITLSTLGRIRTCSLTSVAGFSLC